MELANQFVVFSLLQAFLHSSPAVSPVQLADLEIPQSVQTTAVKVLSDQKLYVFSYPQSLVLVLEMDGSRSHELNLLENRANDSKHSFFDFYVDRMEQVYVFAAWEEDRKVRSGVFVYDRDGRFVRRVVLSKAVDGRKLFVTETGHFVVMGLTSDFYFGRTKELHLLHRFDPDGDYADSFFQLDWSNYVGPGERRTTSNVYKALRPLIDRLPMDSQDGGRLCLPAPGTTVVHCFDGGSLELVEQLRLAPPPIQEWSLSRRAKARLGTFSHLRREIVRLQLNSDSVIAEFHQIARYRAPKGQVRSVIRATYPRRGLSPTRVQRLTPAEGTLIQQVGSHSDRVFSFAHADGATKLMLLPPSG